MLCYTVIVRDEQEAESDGYPKEHHVGPEWVDGIRGQNNTHGRFGPEVSSREYRACGNVRRPPIC
jgi:hypothetical protein